MSDPNSTFLYNKAGDTLANGSTKYVELRVEDGRVGGQISWLDATSAATITLELTSYGRADVATDAAAAHYWKDSGVAITGPTGAAIGSALINQNNIQQKRARLKIVTTANSKI